MTLRSTMVQLPDELIALLDARARAEGVSRSQVVRDAVRAYVESDAEARLTAVYEDAYRRHPPDVPDEWGSLDDWHRGLEQARAAEAARDAGW